LKISRVKKAVLTGKAEISNMRESLGICPFCWGPPLPCSNKGIKYDQAVLTVYLDVPLFLICVFSLGGL
jgi:hypothetical protein